MKFIRSALAAAAILTLSQGVMASVANAADTLVLQLKDGDVAIQLRPDLAPKHVAQIEKLVSDGAYDGVAFHRVIPGFMAQTGDVQYGNMDKGFNAQSVGTGGSKYPDIKAEFSKEPFVRGTVGMARSQSPNSANSQFFIMFDDGAFLNGQYTVVGKVVSGMEAVDKIKKGSESDNGSVENPDKIVKATIQK
ncbi:MULTISPECIES: peptidylprolyl isomerase [unclassified Ochrobactrum]|uniref:peptidylprolyl isomerase n=1 Tax=unclassified Ochrobactrum TaxID=239106 RepID=UPI0015FE2DC1|nr:cyclophilin family peptidyl-prolyl cis-trans isomerase [Ochrobactrum sp. RH2CCR150]MDH7787565.1 peptidylprolyl isomerase [Ochrobactrum sp. 19YEA23]URQ75936.1 MAG: peptidylprolyl isomerase [Candidatus Ochrobactrum gambitense]WEK15275.1 MAG: peptidylprolyl isomerase [Candidatus Ochrobactrum gambitense]